MTTRGHELAGSLSEKSEKEVYSYLTAMSGYRRAESPEYPDNVTRYEEAQHWARTYTQKTKPEDGMYGFVLETGMVKQVLIVLGNHETQRAQEIYNQMCEKLTHFRPIPEILGVDAHAYLESLGSPYAQEVSTITAPETIDAHTYEGLRKLSAWIALRSGRKHQRNDPHFTDRLFVVFYLLTNIGTYLASDTCTCPERCIQELIENMEDPTEVVRWMKGEPKKKPGFFSRFFS